MTRWLSASVGWVDDYLKLVRGRTAKGLRRAMEVLLAVGCGLGCARCSLHRRPKPSRDRSSSCRSSRTSPSTGLAVRRSDLLRNRRHQQRGEPHRRAGRSRHPADRDGCRAPLASSPTYGHVELREVPGFPYHPRRGELVVFCGAHRRCRARAFCGSTPIRPRCSWATSVRSRWVPPWCARGHGPPGAGAVDHGRLCS